LILCLIVADVSGRLIGPLIRFFAHLVLVLRTLGQSVPDTAANAIIQAYLQILEREGSDVLVAMYAACLREGSGEESYARFLRCSSLFRCLLAQLMRNIAMDPNATRDMRTEALSRAKQHNLDVTVIAKETVRLILEEAFSERLQVAPPSSADPDLVYPVAFI